MTRKVEYDFVKWTSFPSSIKLFNNEKKDFVWMQVIKPLSVKPSASLKIMVKAKQEGVLYTWTHVPIEVFDGKEWKTLPASIHLPLGETFDWRDFSIEYVLPEEVSAVGVHIAGGAGSPEAPGIAWFDDLKIYQDGTLIYSNDFSNWNPIIGAGVGAPIGGVAGYLLKEPLGPMVSEAVGAVLGGALGGGVGLLTGMGIIPVPQIPALGAAPEGPVAPARLGKYLVMG